MLLWPGHRREPRWAILQAKIWGGKTGKGGEHREKRGKGENGKGGKGKEKAQEGNTWEGVRFSPTFLSWQRQCAVVICTTLL